MFKNEEMEINLGPQHPSTHGVLRVKLRLDGETVTKGGRVLGVTAWRMGLEAAQKAAYDAVKQIHFCGARSRADIGARALAFLNR